MVCCVLKWFRFVVDAFTSCDYLIVLSCVMVIVCIDYYLVSVVNFVCLLLPWICVVCV